MSSKRRSRGRPNNLVVACTKCDTGIPYNPNIQHPLCASCENLVATTMAPDHEHTDEEEFASAQEEIEEDEGQEEEEAEEEDDDSSVAERGPIHREHWGEDEDDVEGAGEGDLFASSFGADTLIVDESDDDEAPAPPKPTFVATEHTKGCTSARGPSTPPPEKSRSSSAQVVGPRPPNPHKDLSWNLRRLKRFHARAKELIPRLPLAEHRYWIGVLNVGKNPDNFKCEKDFIWMKGNRKTTVETIWHMYQQSTATEGFVILLGHELVEFADCVQELDVFGEKKVIFRAVMQKHPDAKGRLVTEDVIPKDVVVKKVQQEVIILDDEDVI